jgi:PBP1b-binding outer membrane lipoprotein LpoB
MYKLIAISIIFLVGCSTPKPAPVLDFPAQPELKQYTIPPVIKKIENHFLVTDELIVNSTLLTDYYKRIKVWKLNNNIR